MLPFLFTCPLCSRKSQLANIQDRGRKSLCQLICNSPLLLIVTKPMKTQQNPYKEQWTIVDIAHCDGSYF